MSSELPPDDANPSAYDVIMSSMHGRNLSRKTVTRLRKELDANPDSERVRLLLLGYYEQPRLMDKYYEVLNWFIDNAPRSPIHEHVGITTTKTDAYRRSKRHWMRQLRVNPDDVTILRNVAAFCTLCDQKDSVKFLRRACQIQPNDEELARLLAHAYKLLLSHDSKVTAKRAVEQMIRAVELYERRTDEDTYLLQYFDFEVRDFATIALHFGLLLEAETLGNSLLNRKAIDSKRLGLSGSERRYSYHRSTAFGLSVLGLVAMKRNDLPLAKDCLLQMCELPVSQYTDLHLANELLNKREKEVVVRFLLYMIEGWKGFVKKYNSDKAAPAELLLFDRGSAERKIADLEKWLGQIERGRIPKLHRDFYY